MYHSILIAVYRVDDERRFLPRGPDGRAQLPDRLDERFPLPPSGRGWPSGHDPRAG